jgi:hypothetical protein
MNTNTRATLVQLTGFYLSFRTGTRCHATRVASAVALHHSHTQPMGPAVGCCSNHGSATSALRVPKLGPELKSGNPCRGGRDGGERPALHIQAVRA